MQLSENQSAVNCKKISARTVFIEPIAGKFV